MSQRTRVPTTTDDLAGSAAVAPPGGTPTGAAGGPDGGRDLAREESAGILETVALFPDAMPTGVTVSRTGRIFLNFPRWGDDVPATVAELRDGRPVPYPDLARNSPRGIDDPEAFVSV